jgi:hypothetical protein
MYRRVPVSKRKIDGIFGFFLVKRPRIIWACGNTELAANTLFVILYYYSILTLNYRLGWADCHTRWSFTMLAGDRYPTHLQVVRIRTPGSIHVLASVGFDPVVPHAIWQIIVGLASNTASMTADTPIKVYNHSITHDHPPL